MKQFIITDSGFVEIDDTVFDADSKSFFEAQKDKGYPLPIEFRYDFDNLIKRLKQSAQDNASFTLIVWNIGRGDMPAGNTPNIDGILFKITDNRLKGRKIVKIEIAGSQIYELYHHNEANPNDNQLDITDLGGARVGEYVVAYLS